MKFCDKCVAQVKDGVSVCQDCLTYTPARIDWNEREKKLKEIIEANRGKGKYDAIILFSGGKDSLFVLHYMKNVLKARVLAFTWDNGMFSDSAREGMLKPIEKTGVDFRLFSWEEEKITATIRALFKTIGVFCFCPFFALLKALPVAIEENVPFIVHGISGAQRQHDYSFQIMEQEFQKKQFMKFSKIWPSVISSVLDKYEPHSSGEIQEHILGELRYHARPEANVDFYPILLPLSNYVNWTGDMGKLEKTLQEEFGWKRSTETMTHTSCRVEPIRGYLEFKRNMTGLIDETNYLIRDNVISREQGLKELSQFCCDGSRPPLDVIKFFCDHIEITEEEFDKYSNKKLSFWFKIRNFKLGRNMSDVIAWITGVQGKDTKKKLIKQSRNLNKI